MFDQRFFASKTGIAAVISIAAMVAFNLFAISQQAGLAPDMLVVATPLVELA